MSSLSEIIEKNTEPFKLSISNLPESFSGENKNKKYLQDVPKPISNFFNNILFEASQKAFPITFSNYLNADNDLYHASKDPNAFIINDRSQLKSKNINNFMDAIGIPKQGKGAIYGYKSPYSQQLYEAPPMQRYINANLEQLKTNGIARQKALNAGQTFVSNPQLIDFGEDFDNGKINRNSVDNYLGVQHATLFNPYIDNKGYFNATAGDYYDFELRPYTNLPNLINNIGYYQQKFGLLKDPFYMYNIHEPLPQNQFAPDYFNESQL